MEEYRVKKVNEIKQTSITVHVPGSKSITNRALLLAALAKGESALSGVLFSDDSRHFLDCVQKLGIETKVEEDNCNVTVNGHGGQGTGKRCRYICRKRRNSSALFSSISGAVRGNSLYGCICTDEKAPYGTAFKDADWHRSIIFV